MQSAGIAFAMLHGHQENCSGILESCVVHIRLFYREGPIKDPDRISLGFVSGFSGFCCLEQSKGRSGE